MGATFSFDPQGFVAFSAKLKEASPLLRKEMMREIRAAAGVITTEMKRKLPHQGSASAASKGVRFSAAARAGGAAIIVGGGGPPQSWAAAFAGKQVGRGGHYKHKVFGRWTSSPNTIMPASTFLVDAWEKGAVKLQLAAQTAIAATIARMSD